MSINKIFICHSSKDKKFVEKLSMDLLNSGVDVWFDKWEIKVGDSIIQKINTGILDSSYMGIVLSPSSVKSTWIQKELSVGLIREIENQYVYVLPILYKSCKIPQLLTDKKYADFSEDYHTGLSELLHVFDIDVSKREFTSKGRLLIDNAIDNFYRDNFFEIKF